MVGIMKMCLRKVIGKTSLNPTQFQTIITEAEAIINSRPLAYCGSSLEDSLIVRPIDFLMP
ncbi:unnamed protein product, partial [Cylicostephanus goldi]